MSVLLFHSLLDACYSLIYYSSNVSHASFLIFISLWLVKLVDCVSLTISYHLHFPRISKVSSMLHHESVGRVRSKECYFIFTYTLLAFFCCFSSKNLCFYHFRFFFFTKYRISATEH